MPGFLNVPVIIGVLLILCLVAALALVVYDGLHQRDGSQGG